MVDIEDLKSSVGDSVRVRVSLRAQNKKAYKKCKLFYFVRLAGFEPATVSRELQ